VRKRYAEVEVRFRDFKTGAALDGVQGARARDEAEAIAMN
jgi:hypothetical protein